MSILVDENGNLLTKNGNLLNLNASGSEETPTPECSFKNLGALTSYEDLNNVLDVGYYIFKMFSNSGETTHFYILEIEDTQFFTLQTIVRLGLDSPGFVKRTYWKSLETWETSSVNMLLENGVVDNLSSSFYHLPLSANQGRILNEKIVNIQENISKYIHCISIIYTDTTMSLSIFMNFENGTSTIISNYSELVTAIYNAGFISASKFLQVNGKLIVAENSKEYDIVGLCSDGSTLRFVYLVGTNYTARIVEESAVISDNVI